jgi:hypothetical protein
VKKNKLRKRLYFYWEAVILLDWAQIDKSLEEAALKVAEYAREGARKDGVAFYFEDESGRWIKEYPNGRWFHIINDEYGEREVPLA